jgi:hypothetical protein
MYRTSLWDLAPIPMHPWFVNLLLWVAPAFVRLSLIHYRESENFIFENMSQP